jgi:allene oxide cyclase
MTRSISVVTATLLLFVGPVAFAGEQLQLVERALSDTVVHAGGKNDSVGNLLIANPVFDAANKAQLGSDQGFCVRVALGKSWECLWTVTLTNGQL